MNKVILLYVLLMNSIIPLCSAQQKVTFRYVNSSEFYLNKRLLSEQLTITDIISELGEPKKVNYKGADSYFYDKIGVVFMCTNDTLKGVGINFNWDGDKHYPEQSFTGKLFIGKKEITKTTKLENITSLKSVKYLCGIPILCVSKEDSAKTSSLVGFKDDKISQVLVLLGKPYGR